MKPRPSSTARNGIIESLEARMLLAVPVLADIVSQLPYGAGPAAATAVGGDALFAGFELPAIGASDATDAGASVVDVYSIEKRRWYHDALSQARSDIAATSVDGLALFAGGSLQPSGADAAKVNEPVSSVVDLYNSSSGRWSTANLSQPRESPAATSVGNFAIFAGGVTGSLNKTTDVDDYTPSESADIYDATNGQWSTAQLSQARGGIAATTAGQDAIFAGGGFGQTVTANVDIYNVGTGQWSVSALPHAAVGMQGASVGGLAFFVGGFDASGNLVPYVQVYNTGNGQWTVLDLPDPRSVVGVSAIGDLVLVGGGQITDRRNITYNSSEIDIYDVAAGQWSKKSLSKREAEPTTVSTGESAIFAGSDTENPNAVDALSQIQTGPAGSVVLTGSLATPRKGGIAGTLNNGGPNALEAPFYIDVYASPGRTFGPYAVLLGSVRSQALLNTGGSMDFNVPITVPSSLAAGNYHFIGTVYSGGQQVQFASTRQTFALAGTTAARPAILQPMLSTPALATFVPNPWLSDPTNALD